MIEIKLHFCSRCKPFHCGGVRGAFAYAVARILPVLDD